MNDIQIFKNEAFGEVRVAGTSEEPLFCLADVCKILDLHTGMTKQRLDEKGVSLIDTPTNGGIQQLIYVNEKNLYKAIMRSDKPQAEPFQDWVCGEVLPSIRKHGIYATDNVIDQILNNPDFGIEILTKLKEERSARIEAEKQVAVLTHVNKTYTCTEVAKELGLKSAIELTLGWFDIKQEVADNGHIIYHRKITGIGRQGIINLLAM